MKLYYSTKRLEKTLCNITQIKKHYPKEYKKIIFRLIELETANNLSEIPHIPPPRRHKLSGDKAGCWGIDYSKNFRIVLKPINDYDLDDLTTITEIRILKLEDYH